LKILITGGAGFIGHNLALYLARRGYTVLALDNLENASSRALLKLEEAGIRLFKGDVRDKYLVRSSISEVDLVVHAAAYISVEESFEKPREYIDNNVGGTAVVAKTCLELSKPLIYISSAAVYGDPVELPIREEHPQNPLSPYGLSKLMGERVVEFYGRIGLKHVVIRPFNVYGPGQSSAYAGVITKFITMACRGESLLIHGDGLQTRDFIHVDDFSRLVELVIEEKPYGQVFNAGSGVATRILDLAKLIIKLTNVNVDVKHTNPRPGDIRNSWADITKARVILGFKPMVTLEDGIKSIIPDLCRGVGQSVGL